MQLANNLHVQEEADGGALVIDDQTLTAARLNRSARVLFQALSQPRTLADLVSIFADAAKCPVSEASAPVARLVEEMSRLGWIRLRRDMADIGSTAP